MKCPECGIDAESGAVTCPGCGAGYSPSVGVGSGAGEDQGDLS